VVGIAIDDRSTSASGTSYCLERLGGPHRKADQEAILRQANDAEFERYITHAQMKLRKPMRDERIFNPPQTSAAPEARLTSPAERSISPPTNPAPVVPQRSTPPPPPKGRSRAKGGGACDQPQACAAGDAQDGDRGAGAQAARMRSRRICASMMWRLMNFTRRQPLLPGHVIVQAKPMPTCGTHGNVCGCR
jgi:hypothetical protein